MSVSFLHRRLLAATARPASRTIFATPRSCPVVSRIRWYSESGALAPPEHLDEKEKHVFEKLAKALEPSRLEVQDVSGGCGSMYAIEIASQKFKGLNMMKQHRLVNEVLADEIKGWHGVQLRTKAE